MKKNQANHQANVFIRRCANEHRSMSILAGWMTEARSWTTAVCFDGLWLHWAENEREGKGVRSVDVLAAVWCCSRWQRSEWHRLIHCLHSCTEWQLTSPAPSTATAATYCFDRTGPKPSWTLSWTNSDIRQIGRFVAAFEAKWTALSTAAKKKSLFVQQLY